MVAERAGYKNGSVASVRYGQIMKKLTSVSAGQPALGTPKKAKNASSGT